MQQRQGPRRFVLDNLCQLEDVWARVRDGDAEAVHDARVATRRIRAALPLTWAVRPEVSKLFRRMGRQLGGVRELDVTGEMLSGLDGDLPRAVPLIAIVRQQVDTSRQRRRRRLIKALDGIDLRALGREIANGPRGLAVVTGLWHDWHGPLRTELRLRADAVRDTVDRASGVLMMSRLHNVRIAVKKLRYTIEIGVATGVVKDVNLMSDLKRAQEILGELHDLQVVTHAVEDTPVEGDALREERAVLDSVLAMKCARLHAKYLRRRDAIMDVSRMCLDIAVNRHSLGRAGRAALRPLPAAAAR